MALTPGLNTGGTGSMRNSSSATPLLPPQRSEMQDAGRFYLPSSVRNDELWRASISDPHQKSLWSP